MSTERSGFDLDLFLSSTFLDFPFPVRLSALRFGLSALDGKVIFMTVYFWAAKYFTWLLSLYHGGHFMSDPF